MTPVDGVYRDGIPPLSRRSALRASAREALAMLRQASLLHRDVLDQPIFGDRPSSDGATQLVAPTTDVVVLLHGLFATAGVLRPLRSEVERITLARATSFTYAPGPGVEALAVRLAEFVDRIPGQPRVHLVGHSLGGLVTRYYVQEMATDPRIVQTISLAAPFAGSRHGRIMPGQAGIDISPGSDLLRRIREGADRSRVPHFSVAAANDLMVENGAWLGAGERVIVDAVGHNGLLYHEGAIDEVVRHIQLYQR